MVHYNSLSYVKFVRCCITPHIEKVTLRRHVSCSEITGITCHIAVRTYCIESNLQTVWRITPSCPCWQVTPKPPVSPTKDELALAAERKRREDLAYKRSFFVRMVSDPKIYNPKIAKSLGHATRRHVSSGEDTEAVDEDPAEEDAATAENGVTIQRPM